MSNPNLLPNDIKEIGFIIAWLGGIVALVIAYLSSENSRSPDRLPNRPSNYRAQSKKLSNDPKEYLIDSKSLTLGLSILIPFALGYVFLLMYKQDFIGFDSSTLTFYSVRGTAHPMPIWGRLARFWPLGHQEFNILGHFSPMPFAYHLFSALQVLSAIAFTLLILTRVGFIARALIIAVTMIHPNIVEVFFGLVYPERNMLFWLPIFVFFLQKFSQKESLWSYCGVLISAQFIIYYKEPAFLIPGSFALIYFLTQIAHRRGLWQRRGTTAISRRGWLYVSMALLPVLYLLLYAIAVIPNIEASYTDNKNVGFTALSTFLAYVQADAILPVFLLFFTARMLYCVLIKKQIDWIWDSLAAGAFLYFWAYIALNLFKPYYMAPVDFIAGLYLGQLAFEYVRQKRSWVAIASLACFYTLAVSYSTHASAYQILQEKKLTDSQTQLIGYLQQYVQTHADQEEIRLFLANSTGYKAMEFSVLLDYKGFKLSPKKFYQNNEFSQTSATLAIDIPEQPENNRCISYRPYECHYATSTAPDGLAIFLTSYGGYVDAEAVDKFGENANLLFHYQPTYSPVEKVLLHLSQLHDKPEAWMNVYVFQAQKM